MAIAMAREGGIGIIHKNMNVTKQAMKVKRRKEEWLEEANSRIHSELKEIPLERFKREKIHLHPLNRLYPI